MTDPLSNDPTARKEHLTELIAGLKEKEALQEIVRMLTAGSKPAYVKVMIGGNYIDEHVFSHVQADLWLLDAARRTKLQQHYFEERKGDCP